MKHSNRIKFPFFLFILSCSVYAQNIQLHYAGNNQKLIAAVAEANKILSNPEFYNRVNNLQKFDNTMFSGAQIIKEMNAIKAIEITEYHKRLTRTNARTKTEINVNTAKLERDLASITNTLIHETIHAVDWITNKNWDYTHRSQYEENPPISAPWIIGAIGESFVVNP